MNKSAVIHARIEPKTKDKAERVLHKLGLRPTDAIRIFYRQISLRHGLPFSVEIPNELTRVTVQKSRNGKDIEHYNNLDDMFAGWEK